MSALFIAENKTIELEDYGLLIARVAIDDDSVKTNSEFLQFFTFFAFEMGGVCLLILDVL